jgi:uncharacterized protein
MSWFKNQPASVSMATIIGASVVLASFIVSGAMVKSTSKDQITVTGAASKAISSDYATWSARFARTGGDLKTVYSAIMNDVKIVKHYFEANKLQGEVVVSPIISETVYKRDNNGNNTNEIEGYTLTETLEVKSGDVNAIEKMSGQATNLITQGILLVSDPPQYFYTKLDAEKVSMLEEATKNAKLRAERMVNSTGNHLGALRNAQMGVFQITAPNSTEVSDMGISDTSSKDKKMTAVVNVTFSVQ